MVPVANAPHSSSSSSSSSSPNYFSNSPSRATGTTADRIQSVADTTIGSSGSASHWSPSSGSFPTSADTVLSLLQAKELIERGHQGRVAKQFSEAIKLFTRVIDCKPSDKNILADALFERGYAYKELRGNLPMALADFNLCIEVDQSNKVRLVQVYFYLGSIHYEKQNYEQAIKYFSHFIEEYSGREKLDRK